jgi:deoxyribodipyrimidine photo-lyase
MRLRTEFRDREELVEWVRAAFPDATMRSPEVAELCGAQGSRGAAGGYQAGSLRCYSESSQGAVTRLSAYLRHGVLTLAEVRVIALQRGGARAEKLVTGAGVA